MDTFSPTWIDPEEFAYPAGSLRQSRRRAYVRCPDGKLRTARLGIADTFFSVPARVDVRGKRVAGFLTVADIAPDDAARGVREFRFTPSKRGRNAGVFAAPLA